MQEIKGKEEAGMLPWKEMSLIRELFSPNQPRLQNKECDQKKIQLLPSVVRAFSFPSVFRRFVYGGKSRQG